MRFAGTQLSNFMGDTTDFSMISGESQKGRSLERRAVMQGEGYVANAGVQSLGKMRSAEFQADAIKAEADAAAETARAHGFERFASGLAGGIGSMGGGGGGGFSGASMKATGAVPRNAYSTYTPSYNFFG